MLPARFVLSWRTCIRLLGALRQIDNSKCYAAPEAADTSPVKVRHVHFLSPQADPNEPCLPKYPV